MERNTAIFALNCLDLTSLNDTDTTQDIINLTKRATTQEGNCAAVCVWPDFVATAKENLPVEVAVAAVTNFPGGSQSLDSIYKEVTTALNAGATEIDLVLPYKMLIAGFWSEVSRVLHFVRDLTNDYDKSIKLKVILETGALEACPNKADLIYEAVLLSLQHGADFIKTSTGRYPVGATPYAVEAICNVLKQHRKKYPSVGVKISGGVKTLEDVAMYARIVADYLGEEALNKELFRIGASSLMTTIESHIKGEPTTGPNTEGY